MAGEPPTGAVDPQVGSALARRRLRCDATPDAAARLRHEARTFAVLHGASAEVAGDVALAVSEAATNAVIHAFVDRGPGTIWLEAEAGRDRLRFSVVDDGRGMQPRPDSPGLGIGLSTIGKVASGMVVRAGEGGAGTEVAMTFDAPGVRGPFAGPADPAEAALLDAAGRVAQTAAWPEEGVERLADLLVGEIADAVTVDLVDDGVLRRLSARVAGDPDLSAWLADSLPPLKPGTATWQALHGQRPALVVHDPSQERPAHGPGERLGLQWWLTCPLPDRSGRALGLLGLGGRGDRPAPGAGAVALCVEIAERAAGGLAQARVLQDLRATRRRLEAILGALTEAITLSTPDGRIVWANDAAARLLDAESPAELLATSPGEVAGRYAMTDERGRPVAPERLPARRLFAGGAAEPLVLRSVHRASGRVRWMRTSAGLLDDRDDAPLAVNVFEDVTAARRAGMLREALDRVGRLLDVADPGGPAVLEAICAVLAPDIADRCAIDLAGPEPGAAVRVAVPPDGAPALPAPPPDAEPRIVRDAPQAGLRSLVQAPLSGAGRWRGTLTLAHAGSGRVFDETDLAFAADLGRRIGLAVACSRG